MKTRPDLQALIDRFDRELPLARARTIPAAWYFDEGLYDLERRAIFQASWQHAARASLLLEPGAFATTEIAGEPVVIVRGDDGALRAFANVCRHRAARVVEQESGCASRLRCRYHGWTYDLQGRLRGTPEFEDVEEFEKSANGLFALAVAQWGPWVFVNAANGGESLSQALAPLPDRVDAESLSALQFTRRCAYDVDCNRKVYVDNYLDGGYHVNTVHPGLAGVLDYSGYRSELFETASVQLSPIKPPAGGSADVASVRSGTLAQYWWIFPNLMINLYDNVMDVNLVVPLETGRCRVFFDFYFAPTMTPALREQSIAVADQVQREDMAICEEVQRGLHSRTFDTGRFSVRREATGAHFHRLLAARLHAAARLQ